MKVLITGGAGFIGSHLAESHLAMGAKVTIVDNFDTGSFDNVPSAANLLVRDVSTAGLSTVVGKFDRVLHFASPASPSVFAQDWEKIVDANITGLRNVAKCVAVGGHLVVASSSEAYGQPTGMMTEDCLGSVKTQSVRGVYDESKRLLEALTFSACMSGDFSGLILRIFNTYGRRMPDDGRVINTFLRQAKAGEELTVHGDGKQTRSFGYIDDTVDQIMRAADLTQVGLGRKTTVLNVGNDMERTVMEAAQIVSRLTGARVSNVSRDVRPHDPQWRCADLSLLRRTIGDIKLHTLEEGIKKCL